MILESLLAGPRGAQAGGEGPSALLTASDAERIIEQLKMFPIEEYGSPEFMDQHDLIVQLNFQAHHNAVTHSDEFVMEALVSHSKIDTLVYNLLVAEVWREHVAPLMQGHLARNVDSAVTWSLLYHETALANLLEVAMFHRCACEAASEDSLLELADWAYRKLAYLNSDAHGYAVATARERSAAELLAQTPEEDLTERGAEVAWGAALCGLTIVRYLAEHVGSLPLGVMTRLVSSNDTIMALLPLVDRPPWVRRSKGKDEAFVNGRWQALAPTDRLKLGQHDAQVWLALHNLLLEPACRAKYDPDDYRREALLRLRRHLHDPLLDQLPCLKALQRMLDEMALCGGDTAPRAQRIGSCLLGDQGSSTVAARLEEGQRGGTIGGRAARLILEQVPMLREAIVRGRDWQALSRELQERWLGQGARQLARERAERMLKSFEFLCALEDPDGANGNSAGSGNMSSCGQNVKEAQPGTSAAGQIEAVVKVECWRRVQAGVHERWCEFDCTIDEARAVEQVEVKDDASGASVFGVRHRLAAMDPSSNRPLPCDGKIVVRSQGRKGEARLELPCLAVRSCKDDTPAGLWLTVGLLATDGIALQLRLKRADKPLERDPVAGVWHAYHPTGGAVTLLRDSDSPTSKAAQ